jgi:ClpP class serine protease
METGVCFPSVQVPTIGCSAMARQVVFQVGEIGTIISNLWILFFVILILIPALQRWSIKSARHALIMKIAHSMKAEVITMIHRQETVAFLGIPIARYIDIDDSEEVLRAIRMADKNTPIVMILHTPGGVALAATQIAFALSAHPSKKTVIVPHFAMSGGTLIALAADEILMDPYGVLGPVDPQFVEGNTVYPAVSVLKVLESKKIEDIDDRTVILADEARKALSQIEATVRKLLTDKYPTEVVETVINEFVKGKYTHDNPITAEDAKRIGLRVKTEIPSEVYQLMELYKMETRQRRPGVEFVPVMPGTSGGGGGRASKGD